jgi:hypothetical protein
MPLPQIAVEIASPSRAVAPDKDTADTGAAVERDTLLGACTAAAENAACVIANSRQSAEILALVFWRGPMSVRVEVSSLARSGPWATRELRFAASDPLLERWRTAGYTVGVLAAEALASRGAPNAGESASTGTRAAAPSEAPAAAAGDTAGKATTAAPTDAAARSEDVAPAPASVKPTSPPPAAPVVAAATADGVHDVPASPARPYLWWLAVGGFLGGGLDTLRGGGVLRAARAFEGPFATAALSYSGSPRDGLGLSAEWFTLSAGAGYEFPTRWFSLAVRGELVAELLATSIVEPGSGRTDGKSRWVPGLSIGAELVRELAGPMGVFVGLEGTVRDHRTDVEVGDSVHTTAPVADVLGLAGARVMLR